MMKKITVCCVGTALAAGCAAQPLSDAALGVTTSARSVQALDARTMPCGPAMAAAFPAAAGQEVNLQAGPGGEGASGKAVFEAPGSALSGEPQEAVTITASGLKPDSIYTVWLVNMKPKMAMQGVGTGDHSFRSDNMGNGTYSATVPASEVGNWQTLEIALHPDGNPKNMKDMQIALEGPIQQKG